MSAWFISQVTTLTRNSGLKKTDDDEQLHVLPLYVLADVDENGDREGQQRKIDSGSIEIFNKYFLIRFTQDQCSSL